MKPTYQVYIWLQEGDLEFNNSSIELKHPCATKQEAESKYKLAIKFARKMELVFHIELVEFPRADNESEITLKSEKN